jgi:hypothetical protein
MLHAFELGFTHPLTERPLHFTSEMPEDMRNAVSRLGSSEASADKPRPHHRAGRRGL